MDGLSPEPWWITGLKLSAQYSLVLLLPAILLLLLKQRRLAIMLALASVVLFSAGLAGSNMFAWNCRYNPRVCE
jgi:hypothetical protein